MQLLSAWLESLTRVRRAAQLFPARRLGGIRIEPTLQDAPFHVLDGAGGGKLLERREAGLRYNVRLYFAAGAGVGHNVAKVAVKVLSGDRLLLELNNAGPLAYLRLEPGPYVTEARYGDITRRHAFHVGEGGGAAALFHFPSES